MLIVRMHLTIGGTSHEHSKHGSAVLMISPTFNVFLPYLHVWLDLDPLLSITSSSTAVQNRKFIKVTIRLTEKTLIIGFLIRTTFEFEWATKSIIEVNRSTT